jgi:hypothetical protein
MFKFGHIFLLNMWMLYLAIVFHEMLFIINTTHNGIVH